MNILKTTEGLTTAEQYKLTMSPDIGKMTEHKGETIEVKAFALFEDEDSNGVTREILSVMDNNGKVYATNSNTFKEDFKKIVDLFEGNGEPIPPVKVVSGTSKAGREFIACTIA